MDPNHDASVDRILIETLKSFEPTDALLLKFLWELETGTSIQLTQRDMGEITRSQFESFIGTQFNTRVSKIGLSMSRLIGLDCIQDDNGELSVTNLGHELMFACQPEIVT